MRIGELLVTNGLITEEQLEQALKQQAYSPQKLGEILTEHGFITERELAEALEFQLGVPVMNMQETVFDKHAVQIIRYSAARKYGIVPIECKDGKIKVAMTDPLNQEAIKEITMASGMIVQPFIATRTDLEQAIIDNYGEAESVKELEMILQSAVQRQASDIHFEPQEDGLIVKYRIDNALQIGKTIPKYMQEALTEHIRNIANMKGGDRGLPQEGRLQKHIDNKQIDIRISLLPAVSGESMVFRMADQSEDLKKLVELDLSETNLQKVEKTLQRSNGMVLISGPAGSGKTSTMYSIIHSLDKEKLKIVMIEDPMERRMAGITQVEVNERIGLTFALGLRSIMRQDPNMIMVGDIPDVQTVEIAARASLSGRLVLGGIHADSAVKTIHRLTQMGIDSYLAASSLSCVVAQRLARRICGQCIQAVPVSDEEVRLFEAHGLLHPEDPNIGNKNIIGNFRTFVTTHITKKITVNRGNGCRLCNNTGYRGYVPVHEVIIVDDPLRELIYQKRSMKELEQHLEQTGHRTMLHDGLLKAREGITTVEEVLKVIV